MNAFSLLMSNSTIPSTSTKKKRRMTTSETTISSIASSSKKQKRSPNARMMTQMYLDIGQKQFETTCAKCGMIYAAGKEDANHARYCARHLEATTTIGGWTPRLGKAIGVSSIHVETEETKRKDNGTSSSSSSTASSSSIWTFEIGSATTKQQHPKFTALLQTVDDDLGSSSVTNTESSPPTTSSSQTTIVHGDRTSSIKTVFLRVKDDVAIGYLEVEPIAEAYRFANNSDEHQILLDAGDRRPATLGVVKIWVHCDHRRRGVARRLLDEARCRFGHPGALPKSELAMSSPTTLGREFARRYFETNDYLVYI